MSLIFQILIDGPQSCNTSGNASGKKKVNVLTCSEFSKIHVFSKFKIWTHEFVNQIVILTKFKIVGDIFNAFFHIKYEPPFQTILIDGPQTWNLGGSAREEKY